MPRQQNGALSGSSGGAFVDQAPAGSEDLTPFSVLFDVGVPEGLMLSVGYQVHRILRLTGGIGSNTISPGLRFGATLLPFGSGANASLEVGHYFEGDANDLASQLGAKLEEPNQVLERIGYTFLNARVGWEWGTDHWRFSARGGLSYMRMRLHALDSLLETNDAESTSQTTISIPEPPLLSVLGPSVQLGMAFRF